MRIGRRLVATAFVAVALGLLPRWSVRTDQQPPTFRAGVNFVRVDVYPTVNGRPVADLSRADFEVLEDGVPQVVTAFDHISVRSGTPPAERAEPRNTREAAEMAADPRNRLFVVFLDTYHVTDPTAWHNGALRVAGPTREKRPAGRKALGPRGIDRAIVRFLERSIGPDDVVAAASPEMDPEQLTFTRRPGSFAEWVATAWARRFSWDDLDPQEERFANCYPPDGFGDPFRCYDGVFEAMVLRRREDLTLRSLHGLVDRLAGLREGRTAVLVVSEGWALFGRNEHLARPLPPTSLHGCPASPPAPPGIFVGPGGRPTVGTDPRTSGGATDFQECEWERVRLAGLDLNPVYVDLMDRANRANVTFYPIDPRGLAVWDVPLDAKPPQHTEKPAGVGVADNIRQLTNRLETLRNLASATDGRMTETNDFDAGMSRIAEDLSEYYLLGYNSTNTRADGRYRRITVRVKRPGVEVRARRGYRAPTEAEIASRARVDPVLEAESAPREAALASLDAMRADKALRLSAGHGATGLWVVGELDHAASRRSEWASAQATVTITGPDGRTLATERAAVLPTERTFAVRVPAATLQPGEHVVQARLQGTAGTRADAAEAVRVVVAPPSAPPSPGVPRLLRRGPYSGVGYQPTADMRFRKAERVRLDLALATAPDAVTGRLLDRRGQALAVPVVIGQRDDDGVRIDTAEVVLAPLAPGDYLIEVSVRHGERVARVVTAIRIVPL